MRRDNIELLSKAIALSSHHHYAMVLARSFDPGPERDRRIKQACRDRGCTLTSFVNDAIDTFLDINDLDDDESSQQAVAASGQPREIVQGKVSPNTYIIERAIPALKATAIVIEGKEYKYCDQCKKYYRRDDSGRIEYYGPL